MAHMSFHVFLVLITLTTSEFSDSLHARIQRGDRESGPALLKNHKNIGFLRNTSPDPLTCKNHKATKTAFNEGPSSARQRNAI